MAGNQPFSSKQVRSSAAKLRVHHASIQLIGVSTGVPLRSSCLNGDARAHALALYNEVVTLQDNHYRDTERHI